MHHFSSNNIFKFFLSFFCIFKCAWMLLSFNFAIDRVFFFDYAFWDSDTLPLWTSVIHPIHKFSMSSDVFGVSI